MKRAIIAFTILMSTSAAQAANFSFTFTWDDLKLCNTGQPNRVSNPLFKVKGLPKGARYIYFELKDLAVPNYPHGGGWVEITRDGTVAANSFRYLSPCPPGGAHTYQWTATAKAEKSNGSPTLATATARRKYPQ